MDNGSRVRYEQHYLRAQVDEDCAGDVNILVPKVKRIVAPQCVTDGEQQTGYWKEPGDLEGLVVAVVRSEDVTN
jgi:hypothetical protein